MTIKEVSEKYDIPADTLRYYERVGVIPPVTRKESGIRDFTEEDLKWVSLAKCMRGAGLPVEVLIEYLDLYQQGDKTFKARLELLEETKNSLLEKKEEIDKTIEKLDYKISRYQEAVEIGKLTWE